jgi:uncharacterized membrane protein
MQYPLIQEPVAILAVLLGVLAALFSLANHPVGQRFFRFIPLLVFAYFVPTALSNVGIIPLESPIYDIIKRWLLPASLLLLTMSIDIPAILGLGRNMLILFLTGTATVVIGGPIAFLALGWMIPDALREEAWKGLAALSGSWIGGGANFVAIGESVGASGSTIAMMVVVDVAVANVWMAVLLIMAGHARKMDAAIGADRRSLEVLQQKIEDFQKQAAKVPTLTDFLDMLVLAFGATVIATAWGHMLATTFDVLAPAVSDILSEFAWTVIIVTAIGVAISYTPLRRYEGAGASKMGSVFLYLLVASIGAKAEFAKVLEVPALLLIGAVWIAIHAVILLVVRRLLKAPVFYMAVGSQANIGGAASAPVVAGAFHPALAPVGALMGVAGYVLGTYAGLLCAFLLKLVDGWL